MVIACSPCSGGPLCKGNRAWEADRWSGMNPDCEVVKATDRERASPSVSEPDSASLVQVSVANLP